ncbi:MAG TPA: hypothetical protein VIY29_12610, partial [Ktedonobacteraceae bacterium]
YISTSIVSGASHSTPVFAVAQPPGGLACIVAPTTCNVAMFTTPEKLAAMVGGNVPVGNGPVFTPPNKPIKVTRTAY